MSGPLIKEHCKLLNQLTDCQAVINKSSQKYIYIYIEIGALNSGHC